MTKPLTILVDLDNTIYDLDTPWHARYNADYPHHQVNTNTFTTWKMDAFVAPECNTCIYKYLDIPEVYLEGEAFEGAIQFINDWIICGDEIIVLSAYSSIEALKPKAQWLSKNIPNAKHVMFVNGHIKHHVKADILIDDGLHNHNGFTGVSIVYDQPWNRSDNTLPRAHNWYEVNMLVSAVKRLRNGGWEHKELERILVGLNKIKVLNK